MSYPRALVWGRKPRREQVGSLVADIARIIDDEIGELPSTPRFNILSKVEKAVDAWDPFAMTWYPMEPADE